MKTCCLSDECNEKESYSCRVACAIVCAVISINAVQIHPLLLLHNIIVALAPYYNSRALHHAHSSYQSLKMSSRCSWLELFLLLSFLLVKHQSCFSIEEAETNLNIYRNYPDDEEYINVRSSRPKLAKDVKERFEYLRTAIKKELNKRAKERLKSEESKKVSKKDGGDAKHVFKAAVKLGHSIDKQKAKTRKKKNSSIWYKIKKFFIKLWKKIRKVLPFWAIITIAIAAGMLLLLLCTVCVYCCCCRKQSKIVMAGRGKRRRRRNSLTEADLDVGEGAFAKYGIINYSLEYSMAKKSLNVLVSNCQDLPSTGSEEVDPYVVVEIQNTEETEKEKMKRLKQKKQENVPKCKHVTDNRSPVFNYCRDFQLKEKDLQKMKLTFEIFDFDTYSPRHTMLARHEFHLKDIEDITDIMDRNKDFTKKLSAGLKLEDLGAGDICFSLVFNNKIKNQEKLKVVILECKALKWEKDKEVLPNVHIKCVLTTLDGKNKQKKVTSRRQQTRNPYYNEELEFDLLEGVNTLQYSQLRITAVHRSSTLRLQSAIGSIVLSDKVDNEGCKIHWKEILRNPRRPISRWHNLTSPKEERAAIKEKEEAEAKRRLEEEEDAEEAN